MTTKTRISAVERVGFEQYSSISTAAFLEKLLLLRSWVQIPPGPFFLQCRAPKELIFIILLSTNNLSHTYDLRKNDMNNNEKRRIINNIDHDNTTIWSKYGIDNQARNGTATAEIYEQHLVPAMFEPFARHLIQLCNIRRSDRILDVACGTGIVSRLAIDYVDSTVGKVVGIDINPIMLNVAHHCSAGKDIDWKQGSATSLPFPNESFDLVMCQQGLQFFPDRLKTLTEMNRVLAGASTTRDKDYGSVRLVLSVWKSFKYNPV